MEPLKVEKFATANRGNGLRAVTALRPGELLFRSDPLAYTVCKGSRGVVCDRCLLGCVWGALAHLSRDPGENIWSM
uniref:SET domain-containing protein n=1 Tax=Mandrillus leucophaeus TaxID=9568 RepID=A0A2K5Y619_MANLE